MNSILNFWGLNYKKTYDSIVVDKKDPLNVNFAQISLGNRMKPSWLKKDENIPVIFPNIYENQSKGEVLLEFIINGERKPAAVLNGDKVVFNFDPEETIKFLTQEKYFIKSRPFFTRVPLHPHYIPGWSRTVLNNTMFLLKGKRNQVEFPSWPIEKSVELIRWIFLKSLEMVGKKPKIKNFWPKNKKYALVLTHDVETGGGFKRIEMLSGAEEKYGLTSCWNILAKHYRIDSGKIESLIERGHEIGSHGFNHDGKLPFLDRKDMEKRFNDCSDFIEKYGVKGFRSPFLLRSDEMFDFISKRFFYDSSIPDTEVESQVGTFNGCCTVFPFMIGDIVELPLTLPQDSRLLSTGFTGKKIIDIWMRKIDWIKNVGGIACLNTHPEAHLSGNEKMVKIYEEFLGKISKDRDAWFSNPHEIANYWKQR